LWQIGARDRSAAEFALAGHYTDYARDFPGGTTFRVGKSDLSKDWVYVHPGPKDDSWAGSRDKPYEIIFDLDTVHKGPLALVIGVVGTNPKDPSTVRLRVNEVTRDYRLKPGSAKASLDSYRSGAGQELRMYIAGGFLRKGQNVVNIRVVDGSWLMYDYVSLVSVSKAPSLVENLAARPTFLFVKRGGVLKQVVRASFDLYADQSRMSMHVRSDAGWKFDQPLTNLRSGLNDVDIYIPEIKALQKLRLTLHAGGKDYQATCEVKPEKRWRVYLVPSSHFDYGYTHVQDEVMKIHLANLERAIDWSAKYPDFVWDLEAAFVGQEYLKHGSRPNEFIKLAQDGRIGVTGFFDNHLTGICSGEALDRLMFEYDALRHQYGIECKFAMQTDVPTVVGTLPMFLREHDIKYFSHGNNFTRAPATEDMMQTPFYWESPDGSKVLTWKAGGYGQSDISGIAPSDGGLSIDRMRDMLAQFINRKDYPYDAILLHGAYGDNSGNSESMPRAAQAWNRVYEYPKIIFCRGAEFFEYVESKYAKLVPTVKGDGGVYWEDGAASSARETGITRVAKERLVTAGKLTALCGPASQGELNSALSEAWQNVLLYDEHTWGADISISHPDDPKTLAQWAVKKGFADNAARLADSALDAAMAHFISGIAASQDSVVVFNPSSWIRSESVDFTGPDGRQLTIHADSVPPLGYKLFPVADAKPAEAVPTSGATLENRFYKITFDDATGAVRSIYDKELDRELVDPSGYGLNAYIYATGGDVDSKLLDYGGSKEAKLTIQTCANPKFEKLAMFGRQVMKITATAPEAKSFASQVVLHDDAKRIDFVNDVDKVENLAKEGGYFAFPFALKNPVMRLEIPGGVIEADKDQFKGACRDWYSATHFVTVSGPDAAVAWTAIDSPLVTLQDINRGQWYDRLKIENGNVFAYVFSNYWWTNYKASQDGPHTFRFAMTSARKIDDLAAKQFGESVQDPLVCRVVRGTPGASMAQSHGYVSVTAPGVVVQSVEPARFTPGTVIRLREMAGKNTTASVKPDGISFSKAWLSNLAEDKISQLPVKEGKIQVRCRALGLTTLILERNPNVVPSPTASYKLTEGQGSIASDSADSPANANISNPKWASDGGLTLGREMRAIIGRPSKLKFRSNFTISARVRIRSTECRQIVGAFPSGGLEVGLDEITFSSWDSKWYLPYLLPKDDWVHIAATLDSSNLCRLYVNGKQIAAQQVRSWDSDPDMWTIGTWDGGDFLEGDVADVAIWNQALTPEQVKSVAASLGFVKPPKIYPDAPAPLAVTPASVQNLSAGVRDLALQPDQLPRYPMSALLGEGRIGQALHLRSYAERAQLEKWFADNIPLFDCPDSIWKRCYYYRWFVTRVNYQEEKGVPGFYEGKRGSYTGHITYSAPHIMDEVRWLRDGRYAYGQAEILGKRREPNGRRMGFYTHWIPSTLWGTYLVHPDKAKLAQLLPAWQEDTKCAFPGKLDPTRPDSDYLLAPPGHYNTGMEFQPSWFWFDNYTGKETRVYRPDYTAYYYANARAVASALRELGNKTEAAKFDALADRVRTATQNVMWDKETGFFYSVKYGATQKAMVKEVVGIYPFAFALPDASESVAFRSILDPAEFWGPWPVTTCTMKDRDFTPTYRPCNWNGPVWPHAESIVANALANGIRIYHSKDVSPGKLYDLLDAYTKLQYEDKGTWESLNVKEAADADTGEMHGCPDYFHSTYVDLIIRLVGGLVPRNDDTVELYPVVGVPWDHFRLDRIPYRGHLLTIVWDARPSGKRYAGVPKGYSLFVDGKLVGTRPALVHVTLANALNGGVR